MWGQLYNKYAGNTSGTINIQNKNTDQDIQASNTFINPMKIQSDLDSS